MKTDEPLSPSANPPAALWAVAALYRFVGLEDLCVLQTTLKQQGQTLGICGTLLLAPEGINGTIAGNPEKLSLFLNLLDEKIGIFQGEVKFSTAQKKPFLRLKIRLKKEIITMAAPEANPHVQVGRYVEPTDWNALIANPDVLLIDTRNDYETRIGTFEGAIDPQIATFTAFKDYVSQNLDPAKHKKIAMFCTGGIRCEKASSYMLAHGFEEVYHLKGGILKYLETVPADQSKWGGECFVFDRRVAVGHALTQGAHDVCYGCRMPLTPEEKAAKTYEQGVSCPYCYDSLSPARKASLRARHAQFMKTGT